MGIISTVLSYSFTPYKNALYVSFPEHLCFQDSNPTNRQWAYQQMPGMMKDAYNEISSYNTCLFARLGG